MCPAVAGCYVKVEESRSPWIQGINKRRKK